MITNQTPLIPVRLALFAVCLVGVFLPPDVAALPVTAPRLSPEAAARSLLVAGNPERLQEVYQRGAEGEDLVVGFIGGSVTSGGSASGPERRYRSIVTAWFEDQFPGSAQQVNVAIGGTGSNFGAYRVQRDLLVREPDVIFVEFSVNDNSGEEATVSMEALVRQILAQPNEPAVVMVGMLMQDGTYAQASHAPVARHYDLPFISVRDALWPEIAAGRIVWENLFVDTVHPNDAGHAAMAAVIIHGLESIRAASSHAVAAGWEMPPPMDASALDFRSTTLLDAGTDGAEPLRIKRREGWSILEESRHGPAWESHEPGSELEFEFSAVRVALLVHRSASAGRLEYSIDGGSLQTIDLFTARRLQNNSFLVPLGDNLAPGPHRLVVRHAVGKHADSEGIRVELRMVLAAGFGSQPVSAEGL